MRMVEDERIRASGQWKVECESILADTIRTRKEEIEEEAKAAVEDKRADLLDRVLQQFADLMRQSGREIEAYVQNSPPATQAKVRFLNDRLSRAPKKRGPRARPPQLSQKELFDTDFAKIISELEAGGEDLRNEIVLMDGCFMYQGQVFVVDDMVEAQNRLGKASQAKVTAVTTAEIELTFGASTRDSSVVTIDKAQLAAGTVTLSPL
jgi:hypothetical protein